MTQINWSTSLQQININENQSEELMKKKSSNHRRHNKYLTSS